MLHYANLVASEMIHFVHQLAYYITFEVSQEISTEIERPFSGNGVWLGDSTEANPKSWEPGWDGGGSSPISWHTDCKVGFHQLSWLVGWVDFLSQGWLDPGHVMEMLNLNPTQGSAWWAITGATDPVAGYLWQVIENWKFEWILQ